MGGAWGGGGGWKGGERCGYLCLVCVIQMIIIIRNVQMLNISKTINLKYTGMLIASSCKSFQGGTSCSSSLFMRRRLKLTCSLAYSGCSLLRVGVVRMKKRCILGY